MTLYGWSTTHPCGRTKKFFEEKKQNNSSEEYIKYAVFKKCVDCGQSVESHPRHKKEEEETSKRCCWFAPRRT